MRRMMMLVGAVVVALAVSGAAGSAGSVQARWVVGDLGAPAERPSAATGVNAAGQVVGAYGAGPTWMDDNCFVGFRWQEGTLKSIAGDGCKGDMWLTNEAVAITPGGRVLGRVFRAGWNGGFTSYWLWPRLPDPTNSWRPNVGLPPWWDPSPRKGQAARTCSLAADGRTVCRPFTGLPAATGPKVEEQGCALQDWYAVAINDRTDVVAYLTECINADTGEVLGPASSFLAGPDGWVTFGPRGQGTVMALNAKGHVVGAIPMPSGGSHAFLWDGQRIVDLGTLGGRNSEATALNDRSVVVGTSTTRRGARHGFLWRKGRMTDLGPIIPLTVNANGVVLATRKEGKRLHAFRWRNGRLTGLGYWHNPASGFSSEQPRALSLDDRGRVAGSDEAGHAVVWQAGRRTRLPELPGSTSSGALAANATTGIVGWSTTRDGQRRAVLWTLRSG